jgi:GNAT superfamily N-acetyltransferase
MRASEFTVEYVNTKMLSPDWRASKTVATKAGSVDLNARYYGAVADQIIITASINGTKIGEVRFVVSTIDRPEPDLIAGNVNVDPEYRRQGIASAMYNWAKELGNDIAPSEMQTDYGRALWQDRKVWENFADGKKPGRKGLAKRMGVNCKQSVSKLRSIAKNSSGERQRMAHWCANMKSGKRKNEAQEFVTESKTYTAKQVLDYVNSIHRNFKDGSYILSFPKWELTTVPLSTLMFDNDVDMNHVKTITKQAIENKPIVADLAGAIIDGNHRTAAASLMGLGHIPAFIPIDTE